MTSHPKQEGASVAAIDSPWPDRYPLPYSATLLGRIDAQLLGRRSVKAAILLVLLAALVVPSVQFAKRITEVDRSAIRGGEKHRTALGRWLPDAEALARPELRQNPYGFGHWFPTPPFVLMCLVPLWKMGYAAAGVVWAALKVIGFLLAMRLVFRQLGRPALVVPVGVLLMAGIFSIRPIVSDIQHGNLNIFVFVWLAIAWALYIKRRDFTAGVFVGLAIVTKVTPALGLIYFLYKRAWRAAAGAAIGLVLFVAVVPSLYLGPERTAALTRSWFHTMVAPFAIHEYGTCTIENQSLYGVSLRLLSNAGVLRVENLSTEMAVQAGMEEEFMARPITPAGKLLRPAISIIGLAALALLCRAPTNDRRDVRLWLEFALVLLAMLLLSERTWKHHLTTLPLVYLPVWYALTCLSHTDRFRAWFVAGLAIQFALLVLTGEEIWGDRIGNMLLDGGMTCWGLLLCFFQTAVLLRATPPQAAG